MSSQNKTELEKICEKLSILDGKCSALLQLSAIILAIGIIPATSGKVEGSELILAAFIAGDFLITSLLLLSVIWYSNNPSAKLLSIRSKAYNFSLILIGIGLIAMGILFFLISS